MLKAVMSGAQEKPATGSMMVSYVWGLFQMGALVAALLVGPLADSTNPKYVTTSHALQDVMQGVTGSNRT